MKKICFDRIMLLVAMLSVIMMFSATAYAVGQETAEPAQVAAAEEQQTPDELDALASSRSSEKDPFKIIAYSLGISIVVTGFTVVKIYRSYKYNGQTEPYQYTKNAPLSLTRTNDELIDREVNRRKIERNNN